MIGNFPISSKPENFLLGAGLGTLDGSYQNLSGRPVCWNFI